jgi:hypothetical protein
MAGGVQQHGFRESSLGDGLTVRCYSNSAAGDREETTG